VSAGREHDPCEWAAERKKRNIQIRVQTERRGRRRTRVRGNSSRRRIETRSFRQREGGESGRPPKKTLPPPNETFPRRTEPTGWSITIHRHLCVASTAYELQYEWWTPPPPVSVFLDARPPGTESARAPSGFQAMRMKKRFHYPNVYDNRFGFATTLPVHTFTHICTRTGKANN